MFGNLGLHVIKFPSGRFGYVGSMPTCLAMEVPATTSDVLGCRAHRGVNGELLAYKWPSFDTAEAARGFAVEHGCKVAE